jgi:hypothetical protein
MKHYGIQVKKGNEIESILQLTDFEKIKLKKEGKEYAKSCSWINKGIEWEQIISLKQKKKILFYARDIFPKILLEDYIISLKSKYDVYYTTEITEYDFDEMIYVHERYDHSFENKFKKVSYLNTEPLNLECRLSYIKENVPSEMKIYDYSLSNIKILNKNGFTNTEHLPYLLNKIENNYLRELYRINFKKEYDFGIICSAGLLTNDINKLQPPRRKKIVETLISNGYNINIISY